MFGPGTYKLTTQTLPVLTYLKNWDKLFESPFKSGRLLLLDAHPDRAAVGYAAARDDPRFGLRDGAAARVRPVLVSRRRREGVPQGAVGHARGLHARRRRGAAARHHPGDDGQLDRGIQGQLPRHGREPDADGEPGQGRPRDRARPLRSRARRVQRRERVAARGTAGRARQAHLDGDGRRPQQVHAVPDGHRDSDRGRERRRHRRHRRRTRIGHGDRPADGAGHGERPLDGAERARRTR